MKPSLIAAFVFVSGLAAGCGSPHNKPSGNGSQYGAITSDWKCTCPAGAATCKLQCPDGTIGQCQGGQPFCDVTSADGGYACSCANGAAGCTITCPDGTKAECTNGEPDCQPGSPGLCCPAGWDLYSCSFTDGGSGFACHNPQMGCASSFTCGQGCDHVVTGRCGGDGGTGGGLSWYTTCGYPVCGPGAADGGSGSSGCPAPGASCTQEGATCGTPSQANCGVTEVCASHDPKGGPGGCPVSSRRYKDDIHYVDAAQLRRLHDDVLDLKLATYKYRPIVADPKPTHLGFIIEDSPTSPAVDGVHHRVDLYGYVSMVVAGMQVQEKEIAQLRRELDATRAELGSCRAGK